VSNQQLLTASAAEIADLVTTGKVTAAEVVTAHLAHIDQVDGAVRAFLDVDAEGALRAARNVDSKRESGEKLGSLAGVPVALKDVVAQKGRPTTCGSRILENWHPPYDATVVTKLQDADAVIVGKTNMDEFAMGSSTENSAFGPTHNPWDLTRVPGGSSGGSAAAVASNEATVAIGSDTGGSVRQPAALTGIVGVKPTYGTVSRYGLVAFASSLDQIGPFARNVKDAALLHSVIAGHDPRDGTSAPDSKKDLIAAANNSDLRSVRFGVVREMRGEGFAPAVLDEFDRVQELLKSLGADVQDISLPHASYGTPAYYLIAPSEASSNLARFDAMRYGLRVSPNPDATVEEVMSATREAGFGSEVKRRIVIGTFALSTGYYDAFYAQAQKVRTLIARDYHDAFSAVDVIISPTSPTTAFKLGERVNDPLAMYAADLATLPVSLAGLPAMSLPIGLSQEDGLPIGMQLVAPAFKDELLYSAAAPVEAALEKQWGGPLITKRPPILSGSR